MSGPEVRFGEMPDGLIKGLQRAVSGAGEQRKWLVFLVGMQMQEHRAALLKSGFEHDSANCAVCRWLFDAGTAAGIDLEGLETMSMRCLRCGEACIGPMPQTIPMQACSILCEPCVQKVTPAEWMTERIGAELELWAKAEQLLRMVVEAASDPAHLAQAVSRLADLSGAAESILKRKRKLDSTQGPILHNRDKSAGREA